MTLNEGRGQHRKYLPYVFTEHGAYMAGNLLNSPRAIAVSKFIVRAFIQIRDLLGTHKNIARQLMELERRVAGQDKQIAQIIRTIHQLLEHRSRRRSPGSASSGRPASSSTGWVATSHDHMSID